MFLFLSAALAGMLVFLVCRWLNLNPYLAFIFAALIGTQGSRGVALITKEVETRTGVDLTADEEKK